MDSESPLLPLCLPVIDFSNEYLKPGEPEWDLTRADVQKALQDYRCFEASFKRIPTELRKLVFETLEELFDLPLQTKLTNISKKPFHGYVGQYPMVPLYESMGIEDPDVAERVNAFTKPLWPQGNNSFRGDQSGTTDKNIVTILYQNHVEGLEVQTKDNNWIKVKPSKDSFIVMIGDSLHAMLNGRLHSPNHRVMMTGTETRYSLGLFSIPKAEHIISSPDELVDEEHPRIPSVLLYTSWTKISICSQNLLWHLKKQQKLSHLVTSQ